MCFCPCALIADESCERVTRPGLLLVLQEKQLSLLQQQEEGQGRDWEMLLFSAQMFRLGLGVMR